MMTGCISEDEVLVTVVGGVLSCTASADPSTICSGAQSQLHGMAYGGTGEYTYLWTSNPPGFNSTLADPVVAPFQTTTYTVTVNDGENNVYRDVVVTVTPFPVPEAGPNQTIPNGTSTTLHGSASQGIGPYEYQWEPADKLVSAFGSNPTTLNLYESTSFFLHITDLGTGCENVRKRMIL